MNAYARERAHERIRHLAVAGLDVASFFMEASDALSVAVPAGTDTCPTPYWCTLDPASLLITSVHGEGCDIDVGASMKWEYIEDDFNKSIDVLRHPRGVQTLHEVTGGDPEQSLIYREYMRPAGMAQEALVALRSRSGDAWGTLRLVRTPRDPEFDDNELDFLRAVAPDLAEGARRGLLVRDASEPKGPDGPGLVVLTPDLSADSFAPGTERWISELPGGWDAEGSLPPAVLSVAAQAIREVERVGPVTATVRSRKGRWIGLHGSALVARGRRQAAVIIEPAHVDRVKPLLMAIYGLTPREQEVTDLVLRGDSTARIAAALEVSAHTVQEHLKNIFEKTGVRSRRELVGKVFFNRDDRGARDNDRRTLVAPAADSPGSSAPA